ncbi:MAG TPA: hypothetical protein VHK27_06090 [Gammaproteobacteria bacterium]|nr:hypothetical protein [Gammaproteobacteria bacterium]
MNKFEQFIETYLKMRRDHQDWRVGQCAFNALHKTDKKIAEEVHGTRLDTFYMNLPAHRTEIAAFFRWAATRMIS